MAAFSLHILWSSILHIPSTTIDILVSARWPINLFTLPCQKITVYSCELARMVRTGTVAFSNSVPQIHKQSGRHPSGRGNNLMWTRKPTCFLSEQYEATGEAEETWDEMLSSSSMTPTHTNSRAHIKGFSGLKTWVKSGQTDSCCVAEKQKALMRHLNTCRVPACGLVNGSKQHRYEPRHSSWFVVGSSCCLALHKSVIIQCFSARHVINKTTESICWQQLSLCLS